MKKALIIGAAGFVGSYLIHQLKDVDGYQVAVTKMPHETIPGEGFEVYDLNILEKEQIEELLTGLRPDCIFHLAAQSSVFLSWKNPGLTIDVNIKGSVNVLDAIRTLDYKPRVLLIGSGEEYGHVREGEVPITEENAVRPGNIYAATKVCQNLIGKIYTDAYQMEIMSVRAFNHIGPNQAPMFVVADFCKQVAEIEAGKQEPVIRVGNLSAKRDFTDVRDVVRAYSLLMANGKAGETYNVGSGRAVEIQEILDKVLALSRVPIQAETDPAKLRPVDVPIIEADTSKLRACTGWERQIPLEQTLAETLDYWRERVREEA
ncbi:MAG: GDP-mannose 4,6-dehydratase [Lachnospiraceae bacterium]|nr:GDP-mannose 4,6-dehydratase [Lachnospiraceae bacterium]